MKKIAVLIELREDQIKAANLGMLTAAAGPDHELYALLLTPDAGPYQAQLEQYGAHKIVAIAFDQDDSSQNPAYAAHAVTEALKRYGIKSLCGLTSSQGRELLPRIAALIDAPLVMNCVAVDLEKQIGHTYYYSGKTTATVQLTGPIAIYGFRPNAIRPQSAQVKTEVLRFQAPKDVPAGLEVLDYRDGLEDLADLSEADVIISGGRGMKSGDNFKLLSECAKAIGAAVGASRVAVDNGWVPYAMQVGQTGVKVNPKVYIACGISGSIQHYAGMKSAECIIAINTDPEAPIMANCDYFAVADLFEVIPELTKKLTRG